MGDDHDSRIGRRNVLKAIGAAGAFGSLAAPVQALDDSEKADVIDAALETDSFRTFLSEFGDVSVDRAASSVTRTGDDAGRTVRVELDTDVGPMGVVMVDADETTFDVTLLELSTADESAIPTTYRGTPADARPILYAASGLDGLEFRRRATPAEERALSRLTDVPVDEIRANFETEAGGFTVAGGDDLASNEAFVVEVDGVLADEAAETTVADATVRQEKVSPDGWMCAYYCARCTMKAGSCLGCCTLTTVGCIACIIWQCGVSTYHCHNCYDCLT